MHCRTYDKSEMMTMMMMMEMEMMMMMMMMMMIATFRAYLIRVRRTLVYAAKNIIDSAHSMTGRVSQNVVGRDVLPPMNGLAILHCYRKGVLLRRAGPHVTER